MINLDKFTKTDFVANNLKESHLERIPIYVETKYPFTSCTMKKWIIFIYQCYFTRIHGIKLNNIRNSDIFQAFLI